MGTPTADSPTRSPTVAGAEAHAGNMADTPAASATPTAAVHFLAVAETAAAALTTLTPTPSGSGAAAAGSLAPPRHTQSEPSADQRPIDWYQVIVNGASTMLRTISPTGSPPWHAIYREALTAAAAEFGAAATTPAAGNTARAPVTGEDEAEPPEQPMSPTSQEDATPKGLKLTKREIGKAAAALMRGEQFGMKGLEAAYGLKEEEDLPTVWHRFFEDMQSMLLNTTPPEPPASSPFKSLPKLLRKAIEKELASFKSCLRTYSKVSNGLCELQQQFRDGEVSHALRISTPTLQLTDPALQESLNQALDNELKTFKTKAQLTLMGYKEKEKAHWEAAAEVWAARTHTRFESFLEKDLHFFETHAAPGTPAPDAHLKELAADYMARGMARELMYHAVWIKGNRNSKARGAAKREKARGEQAQVEQIQADPSTDLLGLMKTLVGPLQQRVEALEQRQSKSGPTTEHGKVAGKSRAQRRREAKKTQGPKRSHLTATHSSSDSP
ncbi:unnamed protein product [Closterium sp. NIES-65]|nr:unnamed protein product [Closterium sp. NIES-65]